IPGPRTSPRRFGRNRRPSGGGRPRPRTTGSSRARSSRRPRAAPCSSDACNGPGSGPDTCRTRSTSGEDLLDLLDAGDERVDVVEIVVDVEGGPRGRGKIEALHEGLGAVMPGTDADPLDIEDRGNVVRMGAVDRERDDAGSLRDVPWTVRLHALQAGEFFERVLGHLHLMAADRVHADRREVIDGHTEADRSGDVRRTAFELVRDVVPLRPSEVDLPDHLPAS